MNKTRLGNYQRRFLQQDLTPIYGNTFEAVTKSYDALNKALRGRGWQVCHNYRFVASVFGTPMNHEFKAWASPQGEAIMSAIVVNGHLVSARVTKETLDILAGELPQLKLAGKRRR